MFLYPIITNSIYTKMKTILVPIDFSPISMNALEYGIRIAHTFGCNLEVIHFYNISIVDPYTPLDIVNSLISDKEDQAAALFTEHIMNLSKEIESLFNQLSVNLRVKAGFLPTDIVDAAKSIRADLIVMGTKGASGLKEVFFGSITGEVMERAYCPVLAIPENATFDGNIQSIGLTIDFSEEDAPALNYLQTWGNYFEADIKCFHVDLAHTHAYTQKMGKLAAKYENNLNISFDVVDGSDLMDEIEKFVKEKQIDVLAMLTHKRAFWKELFNFSHAKQLSYHTDIPILAIQAELFK